MISRTDAAALIPEEVSSKMLTSLPQQSAALTLFERISVSRAQLRFPVISALPVAYFVNPSDTGLKQTTEANWANRYLNVEEIACICPIPEAVLDDTDFDVWAQIQPRMETAIGRALDAAVFFGTSKPSSWPNAIATDATSAGNTRTRGTASQATGGIAEDINQLLATVEADGYAPNGFTAPVTYKSRLRSARDTTGQKLLDVSTTSIEGSNLAYAMDGLWPTGTGAAELFTGDFTKGVLGVRQDFTYKILDQAVIQDANGDIVFNLAQQDMVAMRLVFRVGWQTANPINYQQPTEASRYPFGVMVAP